MTWLESAICLEEQMDYKSEVKFNLESRENEALKEKISCSV